ncbi:heterokaryon incompatibility protein-domain-containing protein, partial [Bisporella sp. PMI_857]
MTESLPAKYRYKPLIARDAVRVVALEPSMDTAAPLCCSIIQYTRSAELAKLDNARHYSAVSYSWGLPDFSRRLSCDFGSTFLHITPNVESLLRRLRKPVKPHYLWLDAICLNQADEAEKDQQIPLMGEIYRQAKKVHIWLGEDDGDAAKLLTSLRLIALIPEQT